MIMSPLARVIAHRHCSDLRTAINRARVLSDGTTTTSLISCWKTSLHSADALVDARITRAAQQSRWTLRALSRDYLLTEHSPWYGHLHLFDQYLPETIINGFPENLDITDSIATASNSEFYLKKGIKIESIKQEDRRHPIFQVPTPALCILLKY